MNSTISNNGNGAMSGLGHFSKKKMSAKFAARDTI